MPPVDRVQPARKLEGRSRKTNSLIIYADGGLDKAQPHAGDGFESSLDMNAVVELHAAAAAEAVDRVQRESHAALLPAVLVPLSLLSREEGAKSPG